MLVSFECILAQTRMGYDGVTLHSKVPMMGRMCLRYGKILKKKKKKKKKIFCFYLMIQETQPLFAWNDYAY